jgi:hypothetical protein
MISRRDTYEASAGAKPVSKNHFLLRTFQRRIRHGDGTRRQRERQEVLWYRNELPEAPGHPFYRRLNEVLEREGFDAFCEQRCRRFYHDKLGRPSLPPGQYFRLMMIGSFEAIDSERGFACFQYRGADNAAGQDSGLGVFGLFLLPGGLPCFLI